MSYARERCDAVYKGRKEGDVTDFNDFTAQCLQFHTEKPSNYIPDTRSGQRNVIKCVYCKKNHLSHKCLIVTDVKARQAILRREKRCFICTKTNHVAKICRSNYTCMKCKQRHHISICGVNVALTEKVTPEIADVITHQVHHPGESRNIILQSINGVVSNPEDVSKQTVTRILFDGCSQRTYVTEALKTALKLPSIRQESVIIQRFASDKGLAKNLDVTQLCIPEKDGKFSIYIEALCIPYIC